MTKEILPLPTRPRNKTPAPVDAGVQPVAEAPKIAHWLLFILVLGLVILIVASSLAWGWLRNVKIAGSPITTQTPTLTLNVKRTAPYAGLQYTIVNAQYAASFADDAIHPGTGIVRLNMIVANKSRDQISVVYYDIARLLAPKLSPIAPTNLDLSVGPKPGTSESGWLDFPVPGRLQLNTLQLQLGSATIGESLITIPFAGRFDAGRFNDRISQQNLIIDYYFPYYAPQLLIYHLTSVDIRYAYRGSQVKAGQQYYVLNFRVDNPNGTNISPGFGYDYVRLSYHGGSLYPPIDNTLPYGFNADTQGVAGQVVFMGPAGLNSLTIDFLRQYGSGGINYTVSL